jgi:hypothetical protein
MERGRKKIESQFTQPFSCAVCGEEHLHPQHWFLLTENRWMNRVKILLWSDMVACQTGVLAVCCAEHVQELVAHWMATGSLNYPFANLPGEKVWRAADSQLDEADTRKGTVIGELAIHRESLSRLLAENPQALSGMLDALMSGLCRKSMGTVEVFEEMEEMVIC